MTQYRDAGIKTYFTSLDATISLCWNGRDEFYVDLYKVYLRRLVEKMPDIQLILYVGGEKTLHLPLNSHVYDALTGEQLAAAVEKCDYQAQHKETFMFRIENV